jgi:hypothetical protein
MSRLRSQIVRDHCPNAGSLFVRLLYFAQLRDRATGKYDTSAFSSLEEFRSTEVGEELRQQHLLAFTAWLSQGLQEQHEHVMQYLLEQRNPLQILADWRKQEWHKELIPVGARPAEKALFMSDFDLLMTIIGSALSQPSQHVPNGPLQFHPLAPERPSTPPNIARPVPEPRHNGRDRLMELAGRAQYLAWQRDRGRLTQGEYVMQLNVLRGEYGLEPETALSLEQSSGHDTDLGSAHVNTRHLFYGT